MSTINRTINFDVQLKKIALEGTLAWEYNPFRNYRLNDDMIFYKNQFYLVEEFLDKYNIDKTAITEQTEWDLWFSRTEEFPVFYLKGLLVDFIVDDTEFDFDLNHPIQITPTYSYDNSVDLIINDGKTSPKIINSRFSAIGKNKYKIIDRNGSNDTNIYDSGELFKIDTSLYKTTSLIPEVTFGGESYGGNLKVGNYFFYFKYSDADGNESDFVAQSGLVSLFLGNTPNSINTGFRDLNSNKKIRFLLSGIDEAYDRIVVYYSRATSEEYLNRVTQYVKILQPYKVAQTHYTFIDITGFEDVLEVSWEEINLRLLIYDSVKTLAVSLNMLFLGNMTLSNEDNDILSRLALYIIPSLKVNRYCLVDKLTPTYLGDISKTYYNPSFTYNYTGYWDDELYRFGVVFIKNNNTLTSVYNVRGLHLGADIDYEKLEVIDPLVSYDEVNYSIDASYIVSTVEKSLENAKGVCYIPPQAKLTDIIGISFKCPDNIVNILKDKYGIKGFFIVRLKRIPTTLCLAYTIGVESSSKTPVLPIRNGDKLVPNITNAYIYESFLNEKETEYTYWDEDGKKKTDKGNLLSNSFKNHCRTVPTGYAEPKGAICPDYDVNGAYLNTLFTGSDFTVTTLYTGEKLSQTTLNERLFETNYTQCDETPKYTNVKIIGVEDNVKLVGIEDTLFSARAGDAEEAFRFEYVGQEIKEKHGGNNLVRGSFGPYLGITGYKSAGDLITIKIPGYNISNLQDYFKIRYFDSSLFYPISDRILFDLLESKENMTLFGTFYRGDCYICKFTHRLNRNFLDATTPTNDTIVNPSCWTHNINFEDSVLKTEDLDKINLGDVNAVNLGMWCSFILRSNINHSVRSINNSNVDEEALIGNCRGFYPYLPISARAAYKLPESGTYNKGFEASVGELIFEELPAVPYYKNTFTTRIAYSNLLLLSAFRNAYRVFPAKHYRDYPITYGEITKIIEWNGDLICVLEHGIYKIAINERAVAGLGSGGYVYINTSNVLPENPLVISDTFGSLWIDSIIKTPTGIYGVDTVARKIWKVDNNGIEIISDFKVLEFLNKNITLTERELTPIIGIRNVKTHYNAFKKDVMFTFYDDLHGVDEVAWNLCWNEPMNKWVTFYSWLPSFSENIYNSYFSFDRETSKLIALLALNEKSELHDVIYLDNTLMKGGPSRGIGKLVYDFLKEGAEVSFKWEIVKDPYLNYKHFHFLAVYDGGIPQVTDTITENTPFLYRSHNYSDYVNSIDSGEYDVIEFEGKSYELKDNKWFFGNTSVTSTLSKQLFKERKKLWKLSFEKVEKNPNGVTKRKVYLLNIRVTPTVTYSGTNATYAEYIANQNANALLTGGYIERTIAVIPKDHLEALSTDFWKHGQAGIIDIKEEIKPTNWYGKLHPFEFEFIVRDAPDTHKIFDNLVLISNKAEPESFHYEIIGECYDFAKDKKNMYIRQEATKELYQNSGYDIAYNDNYKDLVENHRYIRKSPELFDKSVIFPTYYARLDKVNTVEDSYVLHSGKAQNKNFAYLSGSEIVRYKDLNEYRIWTHSKGVDVNQGEGNLLRGNMYYKEDKWYIQIPSINYVECNESNWGDTTIIQGENADPDKIPIELKQFVFKSDTVDLDPSAEPLTERGYTFWEDNKIRHQEAKIKDKYIKIRIRYSGEDLAVISAIKTLYSTSYA